jgi:hypothetical protein
VCVKITLDTGYTHAQDIYAKYAFYLKFKCSAKTKFQIEWAARIAAGAPGTRALQTLRDATSVSAYCSEDIDMGVMHTASTPTLLMHHTGSSRGVNQNTGTPCPHQRGAHVTYWGGFTRLGGG